VDDVAKLRGLQLRGRTYYSRIVVPKELARLRKRHRSQRPGTGQQPCPRQAGWGSWLGWPHGSLLSETLRAGL